MLCNSSSCTHTHANTELCQCGMHPIKLRARKITCQFSVDVLCMLLEGNKLIKTKFCSVYGLQCYGASALAICLYIEYAWD